MNSSEIIQTIRMIDQQHLDVRTVTMGINLLDCADLGPVHISGNIDLMAHDLIRTGSFYFLIDLVRHLGGGCPLLLRIGEYAQPFKPRLFGKLGQFRDFFFRLTRESCDESCPDVDVRHSPPQASDGLCDAAAG